MNTSRGLKQRLAAVSRLWDADDYAPALAEVDALLGEWPGNAHLHVLRASLIQLQEEPRDSLDEARQALQQAVELDKTSPAAAIELGHFLDSVEDDPKAAAKAYAEGTATARRLLIDGLLGQARALRQLDKRDESVRCLLEALQLVRSEKGDHLSGSRGEQIQELLNELTTERSA